MKKGMIFLCSILCLFVSVGISNATEFIVNGGFETGDLYAWSSAFNVTVQHSDAGISAHEGNYMAVLAPGIWPFNIGIANASLSQYFDAGTEQELELSFAYNLRALDNSWGEGPGDALIVSASIGSTPLWSETINDPFGDGATVLGWRTVSATLETSALPGDITLSFYLNNQDYTQGATAYVDAVSVHEASNGSIPDGSVPDASIMFLLGPGLVGLGLFGRRRFFKK